MGEAVQLMQRYTAHLHARDMFMKARHKQPPDATFVFWLEPTG
jgi:hypothetical protein